MSVSITLGGELAFPSDYIGAADLKGKDVTLTIGPMDFQELMLVGGKKQRKIVLEFADPPATYFSKQPKKLVLNKTNGKTIAAIYGGEIRAWTGKRITLYPTKTKCGRETVDCVRVRERAPVSDQPHTSAPAMSEPQNGDGVEHVSESQSAQNRAWTAYRDRYPEVPEDEVGQGWWQAFRKYFPGKKPELVVAADWDRFAADGFTKQPKNPIGSEQQFKPEEIPY